MAFLDIRFPEIISAGATGGPEFSTDVVVINSGFEQRNANWAASRHSWDVSHPAKTDTEKAELIAFFQVAQGRANGFRFKDWMDYQVTVADGILGTTGAGTGLPTYQLHKQYTNAAGSQPRKITRPVATPAVQRNAAPVTVGAGAGQIAIDVSTGIVTFVADASANASNLIVGVTTKITLASNPGSLAPGELLHLSGFTGADAALLNGLAHTINSITGTGSPGVAPFEFVLATDTDGATITIGSGVGKKYPQPADALTWSGEFDVPARFDTDQLRGQDIALGVFAWESIPIVEIRE